ncbi:hypothetical protein FDA94_31540 [Herbidospora galbida]|uniref:HTH asnC-type domain-containing protein n=1 Tax=Herbidospora galbida TaxID=2575442 RepID=A0A4U3M5M1_9ACTN|nr:Lrp/AsnC family transcriptional regulator [Herbidospora galbida]TKK84061.1 hypothetical protein FDA94_31540 [Herbidospora galbida]
MAARVRRLESLGVITSYGARVDPGKAGWPVQAFVVLSTTGIRQSHQTAHIAQSASHILEDHRVTGTDDHILRVVAREIGAMEPLIDQLNELGKSATSFILSSPKPCAPTHRLTHLAEHVRDDAHRRACQRERRQRAGCQQGVARAEWRRRSPSCAPAPRFLVAIRTAMRDCIWSLC